ncbi:hypothetical protein HOO65_100105 [Ceratocystis lukuohia]|uniref:Uncharacterized protein n=1 Tax=Ceratocystis lukuohia TaxID=2019550 RepID=A0ABR4M8V3_9PEZI
MVFGLRSHSSEGGDDYRDHKHYARGSSRSRRQRDHRTSQNYSPEREYRHESYYSPPRRSHTTTSGKLPANYNHEYDRNSANYGDYDHDDSYNPHHYEDRRDINNYREPPHGRYPAPRGDRIGYSGHDHSRSFSSRPDYRHARTQSYREPLRGRTRSRRSGDWPSGAYDDNAYYSDKGSTDSHSRNGRSSSYDEYFPASQARLGDERHGGKSRNTELWQSAAKTALQAGAQAAFRLRNNKGEWIGEKGLQVGAAAVSAGLQDLHDVLSKPNDEIPRGGGGNGGMGGSDNLLLLQEAATKAFRKLAGRKSRGQYR